jgi:hypothetical protein
MNGSIEKIVKQHIVTSSDGLGPIIHADDLGEEIGKFHTGGSVNGLPVRVWYAEETLRRIEKDRQDIVLASKAARRENNIQ